MTKITFVRHGNTYWNNERRSQGHSHNPLSKLGEYQAKVVAKRLANHSWDMFISSDLRRARETAYYISKETNMDINFYDKRLRENGRGKITGMTEAERTDKYGRKWRELDLGIETLEEVTNRGISFVKDLSRKYAKQNILVVSHAVLLSQTLEALIEGKLKKGLDNCSVTTIEQTKSGWEYQIYNCTKHFENYPYLL